MHIRCAGLVAACLVASLFITGAAATPKLSDATIEPAIAWVGDHVVVSVSVEDSVNEVAAVEAIVVEYPGYKFPLNDGGEGDDALAGDGIWSGGTDVPPEALLPGTYHIALWPRDAAGKAFRSEDEHATYLRATLTLTLQPPEPAASRGPSLREAQIRPARIRIGDHVVATVAVDDSANQVAAVEAVVVEYPDVTFPLTDAGENGDRLAGDDVWTFALDVDALPGTYHIDFVARNAAGDVLQIDGQPVKATAVLEITSSETPTTEQAQAAAERMSWWTDARFGMFIHWGVYAVPARGEWIMNDAQIPADEYARFADEFRPTRYDPAQWIAFAKEAGMKYVVLTTRHHDGFSLFDSGVSGFTAPKTAAGRDLIREYVQACRAAGMKVGFYYSLLDWRYQPYWDGPEKDPEGWAAFREYVHAQVRELMTNYGKIDILWYDGGWPYGPLAWQSRELNAMVRQLQPHIIINNRSMLPEDFDTPEQKIEPAARPWESCMTMNDAWGYVPSNPRYKRTDELIWNLVRCVSWGGNYLLNVGPKADGTFPLLARIRLGQIGRWMKANGESVHSCGPAPFAAEAVGLTTAKGDTVYLHLFRWPGEEVSVAGVDAGVASAKVLATGAPVGVRQDGDRLILSGLPPRAPDPWDSVIAITVTR
ncbi:MAG: alpha-L-fucosidase [Armatimonadota bacterium]|nr:MAG: alpha-L-fucosidase [Armatimonadota bacterium]